MQRYTQKIHGYSHQMIDIYNQTSKLKNAQSVSNVDQFKPTPDSVLQRLQVLEDILCSSQKSLTESQAITKVNDLVEATKVMESTLTNLQEKYVDLHAKQSNYKIIIANMNRVKKNQQLLGSRLELLEKKGEQERKDEDNSGTIKQSLEPRISILEEALFSVQAFEPNAKLMQEMKELSEKNKALEVKIKFLQKKLADTHANEIILRVDLDKLDRRTVCTREELDSFNSKTTTRISALEGKIDSIIPDKETGSHEHSSINDTVSPPQSS